MRKLRDEPMNVRRGYIIFGSLCLLLLVAACGSKHRVRVPVYGSETAETTNADPRRLSAKVSHAGENEMEGIASWYGPGFHGNRTANGEIYNMNSLTAAHPTLPFDTQVRVINQETRKQVVVRINDRGPFVDGRIIDLSKAAAKRIGMVGPGTAPVMLEPASAHAPLVSGSGRYTIQVGFFSERRNAELLYGKLKKRYPKVQMESARPGGYRIQLGTLGTRSEAQHLLGQLQSENIRGFVRVLD